MTFEEFQKLCGTTLNAKIPVPSEILVEKGKTKTFYKISGIQFVEGRAYATAVVSRIDAPPAKPRKPKK